MEEILHRLYNVDVFQPRTPFFNIGTESPRKQVCANDGNLAPPQTEQLSMLKKGVWGRAVASYKMPFMWVVQDFLHPPTGCTWRKHTGNVCACHTC